MDITQTFYDDLAPQYDKLFLDWHAAVREQAALLEGLFLSGGFDRTAKVLDCACGIGTQAIGLAGLGYDITASDFSEGALDQARARAARQGLPVRFVQADFRALEQVLSRTFDIVICMDNALPHMLTPEDLKAAVGSIAGRVREGGMFVASIRDYDALLETRPTYSPPYIHETDRGRRVSFQTWKWEGDIYSLVQYIIDDGDALGVSRFACRYRATRREELTGLLRSAGFRQVKWLLPEESGFYQPLMVAVK